MIRNRMKEHRARLGLKQEELAKLVGVRRETIGNLEKGRYNPSLVLAWNIAKVFGVPIEEVFTVEPDGPADIADGIRAPGGDHPRRALHFLSASFLKCLGQGQHRPAQGLQGLAEVEVLLRLAVGEQVV